MLGLKREDFAQDAIEIWPDNWRAVQLFASVRTQWRAGAGGPHGLDYNVVDRRIDRMGLSDDEREDLETSIQIMEFAALAVLNR